MGFLDQNSVSWAVFIGESVKKPAVVSIAGGVCLLLVMVVAIGSGSRPRLAAQRVSGPLSTNDVAEIVELILRERAPLLGEFGPKNVLALGWRFRERAGGRIRSITSVNGQKANVDFGDRWNQQIGYDYDLERTTNGWKVIGVGWRKEVGMGQKGTK